MIDNIFSIAQIAMQIMKTGSCIVKMDEQILCIGANEELINDIKIPSENDIAVIEDIESLSEKSQASASELRFMVCASMGSHGYIVVMDSKVRILSTQETECLRSLSKFVGDYLQAKHKLKQVSFMQSHIVRKHLANILGLCDLMQTDGVEEQLMSQLFDEAHNMDGALHDVEKVSKFTKKND